MAGKYVAVPVDMAEANALVRRWHRRHGGVQGYKLALAAVLVAERRLCGVVVLGRPLSRGLDDGWTLEVHNVLMLRKKDVKVVALPTQSEGFI